MIQADLSKTEIQSSSHLQVSGTPLDSYGFFYATYAEFFINPTFTGLIYNLATS